MACTNDSIDNKRIYPSFGFDELNDLILKLDKQIGGTEAHPHEKKSKETSDFKNTV